MQKDQITKSHPFEEFKPNGLNLQKDEILQKAGILQFKPYAEFKPFYLGISMISTAEAKNHPDEFIMSILPSSHRKKCVTAL